MLNSDNEIIIDEDKLVELFLQGKTPHQVTMESTAQVDTYNHFSNLFRIGDSIIVDTPSGGSDKYNKELVENWYMPEEYKTLDLIDHLYTKVCQELQIAPSDFVNNSGKWIRVEQELEEFKQRGLIPLLKYMVYFVNCMRENNVVMGVGRGSSVASYILYLIGVHKVDSVKYNLDYKEFFR